MSFKEISQVTELVFSIKFRFVILLTMKMKNKMSTNKMLFFLSHRRLNEKPFESSRVILPICIFIMLVMRTAKIRPTLTDGSLQLLKFEIVMQEAARRVTKRLCETNLYYRKVS